MHILVVDDEKMLVKGIRFNLTSEGYDVDTAFDGEEALRKIQEHPYDLVILDLMLPGFSGLEVCQRVREFSNVPILMLTARAEDADKLIGFEYGADDYMTKPFNILELKARVRAILRRAGQESGDRSSQIVCGGLTMNLYEHDVVLRGEHISLTAKEFDLLELFMRNPGRVYSREDLLMTVWGANFSGDARTVDVHIRHLREKLEDDPANPARLLTKWGVGYYFAQK